MGKLISVDLHFHIFRDGEGTNPATATEQYSV